MGPRDWIDGPPLALCTLRCSAIGAGADSSERWAASPLISRTDNRMRRSLARHTVRVITCCGAGAGRAGAGL